MKLFKEFENTVIEGLRVKWENQFIKRKNMKI
jgi:hypothetical protein